MRFFRYFLLLGVGCFVLEAVARSPVEADAATAQRLSEQRRAELRAALKASLGQLPAGSDARPEGLDAAGRPLSEQERVQRRQQLRQQLREIRYEAP